MAKLTPHLLIILDENGRFTSHYLTDAEKETEHQQYWYNHQSLVTIRGTLFAVYHSSILTQGPYAYTCRLNCCTYSNSVSYSRTIFTKKSLKNDHIYHSLQKVVGARKSDDGQASGEQVSGEQVSGEQVSELETTTYQWDRRPNLENYEDDQISEQEGRFLLAGVSNQLPSPPKKLLPLATLWKVRCVLPSTQREREGTFPRSQGKNSIPSPPQPTNYQLHKFDVDYQLKSKWQKKIRINGRKVRADSDPRAVAYYLAFKQKRPANQWDTAGFYQSKIKVNVPMTRYRSGGEPMIFVDSHGDLTNCFGYRYLGLIHYRCQYLRHSVVMKN